MKISLVVGVLVITLILGSCASASREKTLNLSSVEKKEFALSQVSFMIRTDLDKDGGGAKFLKAQYQSLLAAAKSVAETKGVLLDTVKFNEAFESDKIVFKKDRMEISSDFVVNNYLWSIETEADQTAVITVPFAPDNGKLPGFITLNKVDVKDAKKPFSTSIDLPLNAK